MMGKIKINNTRFMIFLFFLNNLSIFMLTYFFITQSWSNIGSFKADEKCTDTLFDARKSFKTRAMLQYCYYDFECNISLLFNRYLVFLGRGTR